MNHSVLLNDDENISFADCKIYVFYMLLLGVDRKLLRKLRTIHMLKTRKLIINYNIFQYFNLDFFSEHVRFIALNYFSCFILISNIMTISLSLLWLCYFYIFTTSIFWFYIMNSISLERIQNTDYIPYFTFLDLKVIILNNCDHIFL